MKAMLKGKFFISGESILKDCKDPERPVIPPDIADISDISVEVFPDLVIYAEKDSAAVRYAQENDIPYIIIP